MLVYKQKSRASSTELVKLMSDLETLISEENFTYDVIKYNKYMGEIDFYQRFLGLFYFESHFFRFFF